MKDMHRVELPGTIALAAFDRLAKPIATLTREAGRVEKLVRIARRARTGERRNAHAQYRKIAARRGWSLDPEDPRRATGGWEYVITFNAYSVGWWDPPCGELWAILIVLLARRVSLHAAPLTCDRGLGDPNAIYLRGPRVSLDLFLGVVQSVIIPQGPWVGHQILLTLFMAECTANAQRAQEAREAREARTTQTTQPVDEPADEPEAGQLNGTPGKPPEPEEPEEPHPTHPPRPVHTVLSSGTFYAMTREEAWEWITHIASADVWQYLPEQQLDQDALGVAALLVPVDVLLMPLDMPGAQKLRVEHQGPYDAGVH